MAVEESDVPTPFVAVTVNVYGVLTVSPVTVIGEVLDVPVIPPGFDVAVLREGLDASAAQRQFDRFPAFYQGSAIDTQPLFAKA